MVDWYKVEVNVYMVDEPEGVNFNGKYSKVYVYPNSTYKVHVSTMFNSNTATSD